MLQLRFVFDEFKSSENLRKHGIDFFEAQKLWLDSDRVEIEARYVGEIRLMVIGRVKGRTDSHDLGAASQSEGG